MSSLVLACLRQVIEDWLRQCRSDTTCHRTPCPIPQYPKGVLNKCVSNYYAQPSLKIASSPIPNVPGGPHDCPQDLSMSQRVIYCSWRDSMRFYLPQAASPSSLIIIQHACLWRVLLLFNVRHAGVRNANGLTCANGLALLLDSLLGMGVRAYILEGYDVAGSHSLPLLHTDCAFWQNTLHDSSRPTSGKFLDCRQH